jgi:hypothetical protein
MQVKAINGFNWQFDIRKYVDAHMHEDGEHQVLGELLPEPFPDLMCVLVLLKGTGKDRFFVLSWKELQDVLVRGYEAYLLKFGGKRPKKQDSFHTALESKDIDSFENKWRKILDRIPEGAK